MRLKATDENAKNVDAVLLDGKPVPLCWEADDEEGWVVSLIPNVPLDPVVTMDEEQFNEANEGPDVIEDEEELVNLGGIEHRKVKRSGQVEIVFRDDSNSTSVDH